MAVKSEIGTPGMDMAYTNPQRQRAPGELGHWQ